MDIGGKLKAMRLQCGLTQEELADRCELTKGYISQLENNLTSPSIATLIDILTALGSNLKSFFSEDTEEQIVFCEGDFFVKETDGQSITWLVPNSQKNEMEPILMRLHRHTQLNVELPHEGEEFGYRLKGSALFHIGKQIYKLKQGDSFYFTAHKRHYVENVSDETSELLWVSSPPTF